VACFFPSLLRIQVFVLLSNRRAALFDMTSQGFEASEHYGVVGLVVGTVHGYCDEIHERRQSISAHSQRNHRQRRAVCENTARYRTLALSDHILKNLERSSTFFLDERHVLFA
jgi:hypothetical protein